MLYLGTDGNIHTTKGENPSGTKHKEGKSHDPTRKQCGELFNVGQGSNRRGRRSIHTPMKGEESYWHGDTFIGLLEVKAERRERVISFAGERLARS